MRVFERSLVVLMLMVAFLQGPDRAIAQEAESGSASGDLTPTQLHHQARHACLNKGLAFLDRELAEHMAAFSQKNPTAQHWEVRLERHNFNDQQKVKYAQEIAAIRRGCGYHHRPVQ